MNTKSTTSRIRFSGILAAALLFAGAFSISQALAQTSPAPFPIPSSTTGYTLGTGNDWYEIGANTSVTNVSGYGISGGAPSKYVINSGTVIGSTAGLYLNAASTVNYVTNNVNALLMGSGTTSTNGSQSGISFFQAAAEGHVTNSGTIIGAVGIYYGAPNSTLLNNNTGVINGMIGDGITFFRGGLADNAGYISGHGSGVYFARFSGTLYNRDSGIIISATSHGVYFEAGANATGTTNFVDNAGCISGSHSGVYFGNSGSLINGGDGGTGFIESLDTTTSHAGVNFATETSLGYVENSGTIIGGLKGVIFGGTDSLAGNVLINHAGGVIQTRERSNTNAGAVYTNANTVTNITNEGALLGDTYGIHAVGSTTVTNTGTISGDRYTGIFFEDVGWISNEGVISGTTAGIYTTANTTVINLATGLIAGISPTQTAQGAINFQTTSALGHVENSGTIVHDGSYGIFYRGTADTNVLANHAGGLIEALGTSDMTNGAAVRSAGAVSIENAGVIHGAVNGIHIGAASTIFNTGTIIGEAGAAIRFAGTAATATSSLTLGNGSLIVGDIQSAAANRNTILLEGAGSMDGSIVGTSGNAAVSVTSLTMDGADWTISGTVQLSGTTATTLNVLAGRLALADEIIFSDANGSATIAAGGTLQIGDNTADGSLITSVLAGLPAIVNNGAFAISSADDIVLASTLPVTGTGDFIKDGDGSLDITGATINTTGNTAVLGGNLIADTDTVNGSVTLGNNATITFEQNTDAAFASVITGSGNLVKNGTGLLELSNTGNNYAGATTINTGTLSGNIGQGTLTVETGATYKVADGVDEFVVSGIGGAGTIDLNAASLIFGVAAGVSDTFAFSGVLTSANPLSVLTKTGAGTLVLESAANLGGGVAILEGTLSLADQSFINAPVVLGTGSTYGLVEYTDVVTSWTHAVTLNGSAGSTTLSGGGFTVASGTQALISTVVVDGAGTFIKDGAGALDITAATMNNTGNTAVLGGELIADAATAKGGVILANNATITFAQNTDAVFTNIITGDGSLVKNGGGILDLANTANDYAGDTTINDGTLTGKIGQGTLTVNSGGTYKVATGITDFSLGGILGDGTIDLTNANLTFNVASGTTGEFNFTGALTGGNQFIKTGGGALDLKSAAALTGGALIQEGTVILADQSYLNAPVVLGAAATQGFISYTGATAWTRALALSGQGGGFTVANGVTTNFVAAISGAGDFIKAGAGTLDITAASAAAHTGNAQVLEGTLRAAAASLSGNAAVSEFAALEFFQSADGAYSGNITGAGKLTKTGAGALTLTGNGNNYTGGTDILAGALAGTTESLTGDFAIAPGASLVFNQNSDGVFDGAISGSGLVEKSGVGKLTLTGTYTNAPAVRINDGALQGNTDNLRGDIEVAGASAKVVFDQAGDADYTGIISGAGGFEKIGEGALTFTQAQTYAGATRLAAGALRLTADNQLPSATALMLFGGTLNLGTTAQQIQSLTGNGGSGALAITAEYNAGTQLLAKAGKLNVAGDATGDIKLHITFDTTSAEGGATSVQVLDIAGDNTANYDVTYANRAVIGVHDVRFDSATGSLGLTLLSPEILGAATLPALAQLMAKAGIDTLHQRLGDLRYQRSSEAAFTLRGIYREDELQGDEFGGYKIRTTGAQASVSWAIDGAIDPMKGRLDLGFLATALQSETSYKTQSELNAKAKEFGVFATMQRGGWHADLLANISYNKYEMVFSEWNARTGSDRMRQNGWGPTVSLETGWSFQLGQYGVFEPQAQVVWQYHQLHRATDSFNRIYEFDSTDSLVTRAGVRWHAVLQRKGGVFAVVPYVRASIGRENRAKHSFTVMNTRFENDLGGMETTLEGGLTVRLGKRVVFYGNAAWTDSSAVESTYVSGGLRIFW